MNITETVLNKKGQYESNLKVFGVPLKFSTKFRCSTDYNVFHQEISFKVKGE